MPRPLSQASEQRFMGWAQELGRLYLSLHQSKASIAEQVQAYKQAGKRILREARTAFERQEMRRCIAEWILRATMYGPWKGFSPHLRRLERLGYSTMDSRLWVCAWAAQASKGSPAGRRKTAELIADFERRARIPTLPSGLREQVELTLANARARAGLDTEPRADEATPHRKKAKSRTRRSRSLPGRGASVLKKRRHSP